MASNPAPPAARRSFVGRTRIRTELTKVGFPGVDIGLQDEDVTIATALKERGYATGQFAKNHLGDLDKWCCQLSDD